MYQELAMISILMAYAMFWRYSDLPFNTWFSNYSDCICSLITLIFLVTSIMMPTLIYWFIKKKENGRNKYLDLPKVFEGVNFSNSKKNQTAIFLAYDLSHKLSNAFILIALHRYMAF